MQRFNWTQEPIPENVKAVYYKILNPLVQIFVILKIHPNWITAVGFILSGVAGYFLLTGKVRLAALMIFLSGILDNIDGVVARESGNETQFGALFDSTLDRYSEILIFFSMAFYFMARDWYFTAGVVAFALGGSLMVSYVRARAEGLGIACKIGLMQRASRIILIGLGALIHPVFMAGSVYVIAIFSNFTAMQRVLHVWHSDNH